MASSHTSQAEQQDDAQKFSFINKSVYKHLLIPAISLLSTKTQTNNGQSVSGNGNFVVLNIDNEALIYIEKLILDLFNAILLATPNLIDTSPEAAVSEALSSSNCNAIASPYSNLSSIKLSSNPIVNTFDAEYRIRQILPGNYAQLACAKAKESVEAYCASKQESKSKKIFQKFAPIKGNASSNLFYPAFSGSSNNASNEMISSSNLDLAHMFTFPIDRIHEILSKDLYECKLNICVTIYIVSVLEFIATDMLNYSSKYVRCLNKYTITKRDVNTTLQANEMLNEIFNAKSVNGLPDLRDNFGEDFDPNDDDDFEFVDDKTTSDDIIYGNR